MDVVQRLLEDWCKQHPGWQCQIRESVQYEIIDGKEIGQHRFTYVIINLIDLFGNQKFTRAFIVSQCEIEYSVVNPISQMGIHSANDLIMAAERVLDGRLNGRG